MTCQILKLAGCIVLVTASFGCGRAKAPPPVDPNEARVGLSAALDAWKRGDTKESLSRQSPSIQFDEPKMDKGFQLLGYKIQPDHDWDGRMARLTVKLSLKDKNGEESERDITYLIDAQPSMVAIVHGDWEVE